jgi:hypothetical protein
MSKRVESIRWKPSGVQLCMHACARLPPLSFVHAVQDLRASVVAWLLLNEMHKAQLQHQKLVLQNCMTVLRSRALAMLTGGESDKEKQKKALQLFMEQIQVDIPDQVPAPKSLR